jgi:Uma2 family endonuclease
VRGQPTVTIVVPGPAGTKLVTVPAVPDWLVPPHEGWHFEDLLALPLDGSQHIELIDEALIPMSPPSKFHARVIRTLQAQLDDQCPTGLRVDSEKIVRIDDDNGPVTDVLVVATRPHSAPQRAAWYDGSDVILAVEVVSPSSRVRDRERKPQIYAKAAISYLWRIEDSGDGPVIYTSELDASGTYIVTGIFHHRLKLSAPFPVGLDLGELT